MLEHYNRGGGGKFTGQTANNETEATGDRGDMLKCSDTMPEEAGTGTCKLSNGKIWI